MGNWLAGGSPAEPSGGSSERLPGELCDLTSVPAHKLQDFIQANLTPIEERLKLIDQHVDAISNLLRNSNIPVVRVAKGGSYGRGTVLRGYFDGTLVLFISCFRSFGDQKANQHLFVCIIEQLLRHHEKYNKLKILGNSLEVQLFVQGQEIFLELLPAFDPLCFGERPSSEVYRNLRRSMDQVRGVSGEFAVCFTPLQERFFKEYPRRVRDLILLVKHWYQECQKEWRPSRSWQLLYALELLTVYAWEQGCHAEDFDIAEGVRTVLGLITQWSKLCIYWTVNYNFENETVRNTLLCQLRAKRPVILDPTDPTNNVGKDDNDGSWQMLAEAAKAWLCSLRQNGVSPARCWDVLPTPLFITPSHLLDKFITDFLQPDEKFLEQIKRAVDIICTFLKENCFRRSSTKVLKCVKGGSTAKGTALKCGSDADIVVFLNSLKSYDSHKQDRSQFVQEIRRQLEDFQQTQKLEVEFEISNWKAPRVLSFTLKSRSLNESVQFDVLPAYDALGQRHSGFRSRPKAYKELIELYRLSDILGGEFSPCFTELQRDFIEPRPTELKSLIRLVKHWYKQCERKMRLLHSPHWCGRKMEQKASLPPKYALELLSVYAWEQESGIEDFNTAEGFRTVLDLVIKYQQLCIFWTVNYNFEDEPMRTFLLTQIQKNRPVILDPADPTGDVGGGDRWCWHLLAEEAKKWLASPCFDSEREQSIQPWKVPVVQTPGSCGAQVYPSWNPGLE